MTYAEAIAYLFGLEVRGIKLDLERMRGALSALRHPEASFQAIHVAGTNGKGSTSAAIASVLALRDSRVGLYTSPHLVDFRERIRVDGAPVSEPEILERVVEDRAIWERFELSFFEATTALAFEVFRRRGVERAVVEVGLGGRLDATNTVSPILSVITSLGLDHTHLLGGTRAEVAREKAGILRPHVPVVVSDSPRAAIEVVQAVARERGAPFHLRRECLRVTDLRFEEAIDGPTGTRFRVRRRRDARAAFRLPEQGLTLETPLPGRHQVGNASTALLALLVLRERGIEISDPDLGVGLARVRWPARLERPSPVLPILFDAAHNREGARRVAHALRSVARRRPIHLVASMLQQKDDSGFFRELSAIVARTTVAELDAPRALPLASLTASAEHAGLEVETAPSIGSALRGALDRAGGADGPLILVAGSFHTLEEAYRELGLTPTDRLWPVGSAA